MQVSDRVEDWQFEAQIWIYCGCGAAFSIGPRAVTGDCPRCRRIYRTTVEVLLPEVAAER